MWVFLRQNHPYGNRRVLLNLYVRRVYFVHFSARNSARFLGINRRVFHIRKFHTFGTSVNQFLDIRTFYTFGAQVRKTWGMTCRTYEIFETRRSVNQFLGIRHVLYVRRASSKNVANDVPKFSKCGDSPRFIRLARFEKRGDWRGSAHKFQKRGDWRVKRMKFLKCADWEKTKIRARKMWWMCKIFAE